MTVRRCARLRARHSVARRRLSEAGSIALEFALVLPLLVTLLLGVTTTALAYSDHLSIANAAREGARLGAGLDYSVAGWGTSVQTRVRDVYFNDANTLTAAEVCVQLVSSTGAVLATPTAQGTSCGTAPASPSTVAAGACVVKVWVRKPAHVSLAVLPDVNFNIGAQSVSYYGRTTGSCTAL
jgi:Flp pilus assembly protein TadG